MDIKQYEYLIELINKNDDKLDIPVAAIIVDKENNIVSYGLNTREKTHLICGHAEINAINTLCKELNTLNLSEYKLISLLEPCSMCYSASYQAKIPTIEYLLENDKNTLVRNISFNHGALKLLKVGTNNQEKDYQKILNNFFDKNVRK